MTDESNCERDILKESHAEESDESTECDDISSGEVYVSHRENLLFSPTIFCK